MLPRSLRREVTFRASAASETFSRFHICSVMTEADAEKIHGTKWRLR